MSRTPNDQSFNRTELRRALRTCEEAGLRERGGYTVTTPDGYTVTVGGGAEKIETNNGNDLDNWLAKHHADQAEGN